MNGNWTLGQICHHLRGTIEANLKGYPNWMVLLGYPLRPFLRRFMLPRLLSGNSPTGVKTARMFVPPSDLDDCNEVKEFTQCVSQFLAHRGQLYAHPGFGRMSCQEFNKFHAAHAAHHLSFLTTADPDRSDSVE